MFTAGAQAYGFHNDRWTTAKLAEVAGPRPIKREEELREAAFQKLERMGVEVIHEPDKEEKKQ